MNTLTQPSMLRRLRGHLSNRRVFALMAGVALVLGLSGPFGTWAFLPFVPLLAYWTCVVALTYATGFMVTQAVAPLLHRHHLALRTLLTGGTVAIAVYGVLWIINLAFFQAHDSLALHLRSFGMVLVICLVIEVTGQVFADARPVPMVQAMPDSPALVARLPLHKRGRLVSVSVQDHYVDVTTTKGRDVLLMRFGDAMAETQPVPGLQVHRSHWVALDQITAVRRKGDAAVLTLQHGPDIPVSRAFVPRLRDAGLLPRKGGPHG